MSNGATRRATLDEELADGTTYVRPTVGGGSIGQVPLGLTAGGTTSQHTNINAALATYSHVVLPAADQPYMIDGQFYEDAQGNGAGVIEMPTGATLEIAPGATLQILPNAYSRPSVIVVDGVTDAHVINHGVIDGNTDQNTYDATGENWYGPLIHFSDTADCSYDGGGNGRLNNSHSDGIEVGYSFPGHRIHQTASAASGTNTRLTINGARGSHNRRNGITIAQCEGLIVNDPNFWFSGGAQYGPGAGIDIEPDQGGYETNDVTIINPVMTDNTYGINVAWTPTNNISLIGGQLNHNRSAGFVGQGGQGLTVDGTDCCYNGYDRGIGRNNWDGNPFPLSGVGNGALLAGLAGAMNTSDYRMLGSIVFGRLEANKRDGLLISQMMRAVVGFGSAQRNVRYGVHIFGDVRHAVITGGQLGGNTLGNLKAESDGASDPGIVEWMHCRFSNDVELGSMPSHVDVTADVAETRDYHNVYDTAGTISNLAAAQKVLPDSGGSGGRGADNAQSVGGTSATLADPGRDAQSNVTVNGTGPLNLANLSNSDIHVVNLIPGTGAPHDLALTGIDVVENDANGVGTAVTEVTVPANVDHLELIFKVTNGKAWLEQRPRIAPPTPAEFTRGYTTAGTPAGLRTVTKAQVESANNGQSAGSIPAGSELVFIHACNGTDSAPSPTFTAPTGATQLFDQVGGTFAPAARFWTKTLASETDWGSWGSNDAGQHTVLVFPPGTTFAVAGALDQDVMPTIATMPAGTRPVYVCSQNYAGTGSDAETTPPTDYTEQLDPGPGGRHTFVGTADIVLADEGSAGGASVGRVGDSNRTLFTLAAQPA